MKAEDKGDKVVITMSYAEAERLLAELWRFPGPKMDRLFDLLDKYTNT